MCELINSFALFSRKGQNENPPSTLIPSPSKLSFPSFIRLIWDCESDNKDCVCASNKDA